MLEKNNFFLILFYKIPVWTLFGISVYIASVSLMSMANQNERLTIHPSLLLVPGVIIFVVMLFWLCKVIKKIKYNFYFFILALGIIFFIQFFIVFFAAKIYPITDCYTTLDEAVSMASQQGLLDNTSDYFGHYPNNYLFTIIMYYAFLFAKFLKIPYVLFAVIINIIMIDVSICIGYFIVRKILGERDANVYGFLSVLCPTNYVFVYYPYTNTFSMPFILGIIYCGMKKKFCFQIFFVLLSLIGFCLRPTSIFATIGVVVYRIFCLKKLEINKKMFIRIGLLFLFMILFLKAENMFVKSHLFNPNNEKGFPATHWIMVGMQKTGEYNGKDVAFTQSQKSKKEKISANIEKIKERAKHLGITGIVRLYLIKIGKIWAIGTDDFQNLNNSDASYSKFYEKIFGDDNLWLIFYSQIFRCTTFLFIIIMLLDMAIRKTINSRLIFAISLLGIILFLMIWETNKKHSICYTPILILMMQMGISIANIKIKNYLERTAGTIKLMKIKKATTIGVILCGIVFMSLFENQVYFSQKKKKEKRVLYKTEWNMSKLSGGDATNQKIWQSFMVQNNFNSVKLHVKKTVRAKKRKNGSIKMLLLDEENKLIRETKFQEKDLENQEWIGFEHLKCAAGVYKIVITFNGDCSFINFLYYSGKKIEHFKGAALHVGKRNLGVSCLSIRIYQKS